jgi:hypothetical protein
MIFGGKSSGHVNFLKFRFVDFSESMILEMQKALKISNQYIWELLRGIHRALKSKSDDISAG